MILADKIIENRKKNGWSQGELAEKLGVSRQSVSKWEGAQAVPDMKKIIQLSELFGVSTDYLLKDGRTNTSRVVAKGTQGAKEARLSYETLPETSGFKDGYALLKVELDTGRHHQIRVQLAHAGLPILGDRKYGVSAGEKDVYGGPLCLCAYRLTFTHPTSRKKMQFETVPEFLSDPEVLKKITADERRPE